MQPRELDTFVVQVSVELGKRIATCRVEWVQLAYTYGTCIYISGDWQVDYFLWRSDFFAIWALPHAALR